MPRMLTESPWADFSFGSRGLKSAQTLMLGISLLPFEDHRFTQILSSINGDQLVLNVLLRNTNLMLQLLKHTSNSLATPRERERSTGAFQWILPLKTAAVTEAVVKMLKFQGLFFFFCFLKERTYYIWINFWNQPAQTLYFHFWFIVNAAEVKSSLVTMKIKRQKVTEIILPSKWSGACINLSWFAKY